MAQAPEFDRLAEATGGKLHWNDKGMDALEKGWEPFTLGKRVEIRTPDNKWAKGTVVETWDINDRGLVVECDEAVHGNLRFLDGKGLFVMVYLSTKRGILSHIREIDEPSRHVEVPLPEPKKLEGNGAELLRIAELAAQVSDGKLRVAFAEEDDEKKPKKHIASAGRFLKLNGERIGRDIELYDFMGRHDRIAGWGVVLTMFLEEVLLVIKDQLPQGRSYEIAAPELRALGEKIYKPELLDKWRELFEEPRVDYSHR